MSSKLYVMYVKQILALLKQVYFGNMKDGRWEKLTNKLSFECIFD